MLVEKLEQKRREAGLTDLQFASLLGVNRSFWLHVRKGIRQPGRKFLRGVMESFPTLQDDCLIFLRSDVTSSDSDIANSQPTP